MEVGQYGSNVGKTPYIAYNDPGERNSINQNNWYRPNDPRVKVGTGRLLYSVEPRVPSYFACDIDKDIELSYILDVDRVDHPDHTSRFGYARCQNGYCFGNIVGKYVVPAVISDMDPQPQGVAPSRFYTKERTSPWYVNSQAIVDYKRMTSGHQFGWPADYKGLLPRLKSTR